MSLSANIFPHPCPELSGYTCAEQLYLGSRSAVYRAVQTATQRPVVIKVLRRDYPSFGELVQFRNQYTIAKNLPIPGIVCPLSLEALNNGYALVMADEGGVALENYSQQRSLELAEVLEIALQLAGILHDLSQHRVVHKDIKPANILIHPESKAVKLIDFSIASLLPKETQEIQSPNILEGTLAYIAPEQTGRMNRCIDYRADFYSLGVTLYQLLSGTLPFTSEDPLELIHCHLARIPVPVHEVNPVVPVMVSAIAAKLMAKNAEDRYQSSLGLKHDLMQCLTQWQERGAIAEFDLGQRDLSDRFLIPEKLYGREAEVQVLLKSFERVSQGASELMLVAGFSGIGKTAVVNEVHKPITQQKGYFIKGKFDQFNRNIPLSAFVQAFRDLMEQLLSESDEQLEEWRDQILQAVGENGQVLIEVIPELEAIIGKQPAAPELSGTAAQNRFNLLFQKFIQVFTTPTHPLVIFLDDLQWADSASLQLLKLLMEDSGYLLMLGAYRDNEVSSVHPLMLTIGDLEKADLTVNTITLLRLSLEHTNCLVADTLKCSQELSKPLTQLVDRKTQGNPFFTTQFLKALHEDGYIIFDRDHGYWQCDKVNALALTDDVVEFMALQLQKLPAATQEVLKLAACIGAQFDLQTLAIVAEQSQTEVATFLWRALQEGVIIPITQIYKFFQSEEVGQFESQNYANPAYRFLHDRVQQAAYNLIAEHDRPKFHLKIGRLLLQQTTEGERDRQLFVLTSQFNYGRHLIENETERQTVLALNRQAGEKSRKSVAYGAAIKYFEIAWSLLPDVPWGDDSDRRLDLAIARMEVAYLNGDFEQSWMIGDQTLANVSTPLERAKVLEVQVLIEIARGRMLEAVELGCGILESLGVELLDAKTAEEEIVLPKQEELEAIATMNDPLILQSMSVLMTIIPPVFIATNLFPQVVVTMLKLSLAYGNSNLSPYAYAAYGWLVTGAQGKVALGCQSGDLSLYLRDKLNTQVLRTKLGVLYNAHIIAYREPLRNTLNPLRELMYSGLDTGDLEYASYAAMHYCHYPIWAGETLDVVAQEQERVIAFIDSYLKQSFSREFSCVWRQMVYNLRQTFTEQVFYLIGDYFNEEESLPELETGKVHNTLVCFYLAKSFINYLFGRYEQSAEFAAQCGQHTFAIPGVFTIPMHNFVQSLAELAQYQNHPQADLTAVLDLVDRNQAWLKVRVDAAPVTFQHKYDLVEAERHRILSNRYQAMELYDLAIAGAKANDYIQEEALANELAAKFYLDWGKEKVAAGYMQEAYYGYSRWGAKAKVQDLEQRYPELLAPILQPQQATLSAHKTVFSPQGLASLTFGTQFSSSGNTSASATLDLATVLKASQTLSSAIELDKLLATLLHTVLENAGADKGVLLMPNDNQWFVEAIATIDQPAQIQSIALSSSSEVPHSLINTVKRSREAVVIVDAAAHPILATDTYVAQQQSKSLLCTPILNQGKLVAILYLENHVTVGAFTSDRVELLNILCAQAAISLDNARLYQQSQSYAQQLERSLHQLSDSQSQLQALAKNIPGVIFKVRINLKDASDSTLYASSGCYELYGVTAESFMAGEYFFRDFDHPDDRPKMNQAIQKSLKNLTPLREELRIITKTGETKWIQVAAQPQILPDEFLIYDGVLLDISDRKASELALRESENKFRTLLSNLDGAVYRCQNDAAWTTEFMSDYITTLTGYPASDFINNKCRTYTSLIHPDDIERVERIVRERIAQHQSFTIEYRIIHREGWVRWVSENGKGIFDEQNQLRFLEGVIVDISDRKLAEENSRLLSSVVESSHDAIITKTLNSIITSWNQAATDLFGYTEDEAIGQSVLMLFPDDRIKEESLIISYLKQNKQIDSHETVRLHQDGTPIDCSVTISPLLTENGKVIGASSIFRDIRDRKRLESEQQRLIDVLEATPDYIGIASANGKILWHNKQLRELRQDLVSHKNISECHPAWVNEIILNQVFPILIEQGSWSGELALLDSNGKEIPVSQVIIAHKSQLGEIQYVSTIMRDISDRKAYQEQLEQTNAELIRATRMKDEFLATMSHELRTPMHAILGMTEVLQDEIFGDLNQKQLKALATVERSGNHLLELINDILDVSKIASGQIELDYQNMAIIPLCQQSLEFIKPQAAKKSIQTEIKLPIESPSLNLDERRIRQVLINLLSNAVKFTPEGGCITLEVIYPITIKQKSYLQVNFKDTGIGIAPENLQKVFEPFIQVDSALNRQYEGTGLGLALVKRIVELHQGEVMLTSELGVGSCFAIILPL